MYASQRWDKPASYNHGPRHHLLKIESAMRSLIRIFCFPALPIRRINCVHHGFNRRTRISERFLTLFEPPARIIGGVGSTLIAGIGPGCPRPLSLRSQLHWRKSPAPGHSPQARKAPSVRRMLPLVDQRHDGLFLFARRKSIARRTMPLRSASVKALEWPRPNRGEFASAASHMAGGK